MKKSNTSKNPRLAGRWLLRMVIVMTCMFTFAMSATAFASGTTTVDDATADNWVTLNYDASEGRTTKNDGRIWTDKSVYDGNAKVLKNQSDFIEIAKSANANFLVGLSALSSTMSVDGVTEKPLDIIMVLDVSGSMAESMGYEKIYAEAMTYQGDYYIQRNNGYTKLSYGNRGWYYEADRRNVYITPKTGASDTSSNSIQVYRAVSKMKALETSVNAFVDKTKEMNSKITDASKQHRIALVKFSGNKSNNIGNTTYVSGGHTYNHSQTVKEFAAVTAANVNSFHAAVESLNPAGATRADNGLDVAKGVMGSARDNAQPVVIFFTDGVPTSFSGWNADVANAAIGHAKNMKDNGAWIYSVGVFEESALTGGNLNNYMNAVSGNYPKATGYTGNTMGARVAGGDYYSIADDAAGLEAIFEAIAAEISGKSAAVPTHVDEGYDAAKGGYITFVDKLGDYMEVTSFNSIVYGGVEYKNTLSDTAWEAAGNDTDVFASDLKVINDLGEEVSIGAVVVTIERSEDARTGDTITVKVPAALVPLTYYNVAVSDEGAITERIPTTPIRAFYEVSVKAEVDDLLVNPDADMKAYLAAHTDKDGKAVFYSNAYDAENNAEIGSTVASFVPSKTNDMYFAVEDTYIFRDEACTIPVTRLDESATYYYQRVYYVKSDTPIAPKYETVAFPASILRNVEYAFNEDGQLYVKAGTGRYTRADAADTAKGRGANKTETASEAAAPRWENWNVPGAAVSVHLGNNGILKKAVAGTLAISKEVVVPEWSEVDAANKEFSFEIALTKGGAALEGTFKAQVKDVEGKNVGDGINVVTDSEGHGTVILKDGQTLYIYGLPEGTEYKVRETGVAGGFKQTAPADDRGQPVSAEGTIDAGETTTVSFVNEYVCSDITVDTGANAFITKVFEGRQWLETDTFSFEMSVAEDSADNTPMPEKAVNGVAAVTVSKPDDGNKAAVDFGSIVFTKPGVYRYDITEIKGNIPNVTYDGHTAELIVTVKDNGLGKLAASTEVEGATFINTYEAEPTAERFEGTKEMANRDLAAGEFEFVLAYAADPAKSSISTVTNDGNGNVSFNEQTYTPEVLAELVERGYATKAVDGMIDTYTISYIAFEKAGDSDSVTHTESTFAFTVTVTDEGTGKLTSEINYPETGLAFKNEYKAAPIEYNVKGLKVLNSEDGSTPAGIEGKFTFELAAITEGAPLPQNTKATNDALGNVDFGSIQFNLSDLEEGEQDNVRTKTFEYSVTETGSAPGVSNDPAATKTFSITVNDDGKGNLVAVADPAEGPVFTFRNTYEPAETTLIVAPENPVSPTDPEEPKDPTTKTGDDSNILPFALAALAALAGAAAVLFRRKKA